MESVLKSRYSRAQLKEGCKYYQVKDNQRTFVGTFVRSYSMGSGDGMTIHAEFLRKGKPYRVDEEMWGYVDGHGLSWYEETD